MNTHPVADSTSRRFRHYTFFILHFALAALCAAQTRDDNRRLIWTGSAGAEWSGSSWKTTGSFLSYANSATATWSPVPDLAVSSMPFLGGDSVIFDDTGDSSTRDITIADEGVVVSDMVVSGAGDYTFSGGAITASSSSLTPNTYQLTQTGVVPGGRLLKVGAGTLTFSNTAANTFEGGVILAGGCIAIADARAFGNNSIVITATGGGSHLTPAIVTDAAGSLFDTPRLTSGTLVFAPDLRLAVAAAAAGLEITGDIFFNTGSLAATNALITLDIEGDTTISGRFYAGTNLWNSTAGSFNKTGAGTLTLTGSLNWLRGPNTVSEGRLIITNVGAIGSGDITIGASGTLTIQGIRDGSSFPMRFLGPDGRLEVVDSNVAFSWRAGTLVGDSGGNTIGTLVVTATSRLTAYATGTNRGALGTDATSVFVSDNSTLILGREGIAVNSPVGTPHPVNIATVAGNLDLSGNSTLVLLPNTNLKLSGTLNIDAGSQIALTGGGVARLEYAAGPADPDVYVPAGMSLTSNATPVGATGRQFDYLVVNQGANPLKDIAMMIDAIDAGISSISSRLDNYFLMPAAAPEPGRGRQWTNSLWARYYTSQIDYDTVSPEFPGHTADVNGMLAGIDAAFRQRFLIGLYAALGENNLDTTNDTTLRSKQHTFGLYTAVRFKYAYASVHLAVGDTDADSWRREPAGQTRGEWTNDFVTAGLEVGAIFTPWKNGLLKPRIGLHYTDIKVSDFKENGVSPMRVDDFTDSLTRADIGLQAAQRFTIPLVKLPASLGLNLAWKHAMREPRETIMAAYASAPELPAQLERGDYYRDAAVIGVNFRVSFPRNIHAAFDYEHQTGSSRTGNFFGALLGVTW
ncbi:autotransporter outer membrane beta-barrel domain-containing protein [Ereboglobus luteus]|uniref:Autotransporter domain-containing protein n=1 Tax=Ereboglobus luteus TaxID=1796921 RepID=A0A2U8DZX6_9BACT|nr:autotransporter outer membrane beta-barrel domain-containing protein [Ereboglobus luteus]AWI08157.1 hypothetical protein CKA38_01760 [Ereboglobus luteus]